MAPLAQTAVEMLDRIDALDAALGPKLAEVQAACQRLSEAGSKVEESWSGSALGYHCELHYGDFEKPPLEARFNPEWGGIHGLPRGWAARAADEVKDRIEQLSGTTVSVVEAQTDAVLREAKALQVEIVTELSTLHASVGLEHEKELLHTIENSKWGKTIAEYMKANFPTGFVSRDMRAISQGSRVPAHLYYLAVAFQCDSQCAAVRDFILVSRRLLRQLELNAPIQDTEGADQRPIKAVLAVCNRFHQVARQLTHRRQGRQTLEITDEYDVQDLLHALLRLHVDDIRPEEWTPSYGGSASRMDFLLKEEQLVVEAKMTRAGLGAREVTDQLAVDAARYRVHPNCKTLVCLVYDPSSLVKNPRGVERDLATLSGNGLEVICVITP